VQVGAGGAGIGIVSDGLLVDGMLGDLARKLRLLGFDTAYMGGVTDDFLLEFASETGRILISRDSSLCSRAGSRGLRAICASDLITVLLSLGLRSVSFDPSSARCPHCNTPVTEIDDVDLLRGEIPPDVMVEHSSFYKCFGCGRVYWIGSHWGNIKKLERELNRSLGMSFEDYSLDEGKYLVALARRSMETYLRDGKTIGVPADVTERLRARRGAFVTLRTYPGGELRGCIGRPYPTQPLVNAVIDSAVDASVNDPRFEPMRYEEVDRVTVEVSVLTEPRDLEYRNPLELKDKVEIGRDGLIVMWTMGSGLLLPQVPVEEGWDVEEYLSYACMKAGAPPDCWLSTRPRIQAFQAIVFEEVAPRGEVVRKNLERR